MYQGDNHNVLFPAQEQKPVFDNQPFHRFKTIILLSCEQHKGCTAKQSPRRFFRKIRVPQKTPPFFCKWISKFQVPFSTVPAVGIDIKFTGGSFICDITGLKKKKKKKKNVFVFFIKLPKLNLLL